MADRETMAARDGVETVRMEDGSYRFALRGELDHHSVKGIREAIDAVLIDYRPRKVIFDLGEVGFSDSAGLGLILGRYTRIRDYGGTLVLSNVSEDFMKILRLAGAERFLRIEEKRKKATV